jgi:hypothetical protein
MAIYATTSIRGRDGKPYLGSDTQFTEHLNIFTDSADQGVAEILASGVIPARGTRHPVYVYCAAFDADLKQEDLSPRVWRCKILYKTDSIPQSETNKSVYPNPLDRPAEFEWDAVGYQKIITATVEDYTPPGGALIKAGTPIRNSAIDRYDPPIEITDYRFTCTATKFIKEVPIWVLFMAGRVNRNAYRIDGVDVPPMASRIVGLRIGKFMRDNGVDCREVRLTIEFRDPRDSRYVDDKVPEPYILEVQDEGYNYWNLPGGGASRGRIRIPNYKGAIINTTLTDPVAPVPVLLDGHGMPLISPDFSNTVLTPWCVYRTADYSSLNVLE